MFSIDLSQHLSFTLRTQLVKRGIVKSHLLRNASEKLISISLITTIKREGPLDYVSTTYLPGDRKRGVHTRHPLVVPSCV